VSEPARGAPGPADRHRCLCASGRTVSGVPASESGSSQGSDGGLPEVTGVSMWPMPPQGSVPVLRVWPLGGVTVVSSDPGAVNQSQAITTVLSRWHAGSAAIGPE